MKKIIPDINLNQFIIFIITTVYILSTAANIHMFHFILDINLAKIGMAVAVLGYGLIINKQIITILSHKNLRILLLISFCWIIYLFINSLIGASPIVSIKLVLRIVGSLIIAFEIGMLLSINKKHLPAFLSSFIVCLIIITIIWVLERNEYVTFAYLKNLMPDYFQTRGEAVSSGLYINPNELGFALVMQTGIILWYSIHPIRSLAIFPLTVFVAGLGILQVDGRNPFIGFLVVIIFWVITYLNLVIKAAKRRNKRFYYLLPFLVLVLGSLIVISTTPPRVSHTIQTFWNRTIASPNFESNDLLSKKSIRGIPLIHSRLEIWDLAYKLWKEKPFIGIGVGSFQTVQKLGEGFNTHNFLFGVLTEQGVFGIGFLLLFCTTLLIQMKKLEGTTLLCFFPLTLMFDDTSWSYVFPLYVSIIIGYCVHLAISDVNDQPD